MNADYKRGQNVALWELAMHVGLFVLLGVVALGSGTNASMSICLLHLGGLAIWAMTALLFYCRNMARMEELELEELAQTRGDQTIFGEHAAELRIAQQRLRLVRRIIIPIGTLLLSAYLIVMGVLPLWAMNFTPLAKMPIDGAPLTWGFVCLGGAFVAFLFSRYAIGMGREPRWRLLRAGGSYLTVSSLLLALLCGAFFAAHAGVPYVLWVLTVIVPALMVLLGVEMITNLVLDLYRPRKPGVEARPAFDSRLANLLSEPGSLAHSIAEALNYQFGFEVSSTWFYQLLRKTLAPLLIFGALALLAMTTLVLVPPGKQAVVLTWGTVSDDKFLEPGLHFLTWPWPIRTAEVFDADRIRTLRIGVGEARDEREIADSIVNGVTLELWGQEHGIYREANMIVARRDMQETPTTKTGDKETRQRSYGSVGLLRVVMTLHYKVNDVLKFHYRAADAEGTLRDIAAQQLTHYVAQRDVDTLMSAKRNEVTAEIHKRITAAADKLKLGVQITLVAIDGIHPPKDVADAFEDVIKADRERVALKEQAMATYNAKLSSVAGSPETAEKLIEAITRIRSLEETGAATEEVTAAERDAEVLLAGASGTARQLINDARADRWTEVNRERGRWASFQQRLKTYQTSPKVYAISERLRVLSEIMLGNRTYVVGVDPSLVEIRMTDKRKTAAGGMIGLDD